MGIDTPILDLTCQQGTDWSRLLVWKIKNEAGVAEPVNLTGWSARMQARRWHDGEIAASLSSDPGEEDGLITLSAEGEIMLSLTEEQTRAIPVDLTRRRRGAQAVEIHRYDLELISPGGDVERLVEGTFTITAEVTQ
jgi:hypothetical protein